MSFFDVGCYLMAKSYLICDVIHFHKTSHQIPIQQEIFKTEGNPETSLNIIDHNYHKTFDRYSCHHDYKHNKFGKVYNQTFSYYFEPVNFYMYYDKDQRLALIGTKTDVAIDFIKKLSENGYHELHPVEINLALMYPLIMEIRGVWISNLNQTYLKTAGFFGPNVNKSEEFKQASEIGDVSSLRLVYVHPESGEELDVGISKKGSVTLYNTFDRVEDEIDVVLDIYNKLIKPAHHRG